jgi:hypothetical protein
MSEKKNNRKLWFYYAGSTVYGPLDDTEIKVKLSNMPAKDGIQIWRLGSNSTLRFSEWIDENSPKANLARGKVVHILVGQGLTAGPFEPFEAVHYLRELNKLDDTFIKIDGRFNEWKPVQSIDEVINVLRSDVRQFPRLSCDGEVFLSSKDFNCKARLLDISLAGFRCILLTQNMKDESKVPVLGSVKITGVDETIYFQAHMRNRIKDELGFKFSAIEQRFSDLLESYLAFRFRQQATEAFLQLRPQKAA